MADSSAGETSLIGKRGITSNDRPIIQESKPLIHTPPTPRKRLSHSVEVYLQVFQLVLLEMLSKLFRPIGIHDAFVFIADFA